MTQDISAVPALTDQQVQEIRGRDALAGDLNGSSLAARDRRHLLADRDRLEREVERLAELDARRLDLLRTWEERVRCPQCGEHYSFNACGPTHAVVYALVYPAVGEGDQP